MLTDGDGEAVPTLAGGASVQGYIRARVFGIKLLRLEADVVLLPAAVRRRAAEAPSTSEGLPPEPRDDSVATGDPLPTDVDSTEPSSIEAAGMAPRSLGDAYQLLRESEGSLRRARHPD